MTGFELWKFLHVLSAIVWVGAGIGLMALDSRVRAGGDVRAQVAIGQASEELGTRLFMPASLGTLVFGVIMVLTVEEYAFEDAWIAIGLAAVVISAVIGAVFISRTGREIVAEAEGGTPDPTRMAALKSRLRTLNVIDLVVLVVAVWAMVAKPGG